MTRSIKIEVTDIEKGKQAIEITKEGEFAMHEIIGLLEETKIEIMMMHKTKISVE